MSANFMGGPRVALARIRDSRKQKLQQNALAQGATGATTAAAGASRRAEDAADVEGGGSTSASKGAHEPRQPTSDRASPSKKQRKEDGDDASRGRSIDTTANRRDFNHQAGSKSGSVERVIADEHESKFEDQQQSSPRSTLPDLDQKRRLLLDHDDWLGAGEIEGILRKKRKKGESRTGKREKKKKAAASAPGEDHGQELSGSREGDRGRTDVAGLDSAEGGRHQHAPEEQVHQAATSSRRDDHDAGKGTRTLQQRGSSTKLQQHPLPSEPFLPTNGLPALSLHPEALYTNSIKGLFTSGALSMGHVKAQPAAAPSSTKGSAGNAYLGDEGASEAVINEAKAPLEEAPRRQGRKAEAEAEAKDDSELEDLEGLLLKQREETSRRLFGGH